MILAHCSQTLFFTSRFQISWIFCWDFVQTHLIDPSFPTHLAHEFKVKWWSKFSPSSSQQLPHIKNWIVAKAPSNIQNPFQLLSFLSEGITTQPTPLVVHSSNKMLKEHLKLLQQRVIEALSQLALDSDDDDLTSSIFKEPQNEYMCCGLPYTLLG